MGERAGYSARTAPTVLHIGRSTIQDSDIPSDPSQIAKFIRDNFRASGRTSSADAREQMIARIRGTVFGQAATTLTGRMVAVTETEKRK